MGARPAIAVWVLIMTALLLSRNDRVVSAIVCAVGAAVIWALAPDRKKGP